MPRSTKKISTEKPIAPARRGPLSGAKTGGGVTVPRRRALTHIRLAKFIRGLTVSQGAGEGESFKLLPWQVKFLAGAFGIDTFTSALSEARGNGKTAFAAAIGAATIASTGPLVRRAAETVIVASSFGQALIAFRHVLRFLADDLENKHLYRVMNSQNVAQIERRDNGAILRCLGSDPARAHGLAPSLILADEPAQWPPAQSDKMRAALATALGKISGGRFIALGTRPADSDHWFAKMLSGGADYSQLHAADPEGNPFSPKQWHAANPSLRFMPELRRVIEAEASKAKRDAGLLASFNALRLNLGTPDSSVRQALIEAATWSRIEGEAKATGPISWGIDLGGSAAQSAIAAYYPQSGRLDCLAAFPGKPDLAARAAADSVGNIYERAAAAGDLVQLGGHAVDVPALLRLAIERFGRPDVIAADRWRFSELCDGLNEAGVLRVPLELRGMGFKDGAEDVRIFRRACAEGKVSPRRSVLLRSALSEATTISDPAGNSKLAKGTEGGRRLRARDDAAAAAILAVAEGQRRVRKNPGHAGGIRMAVA